MAAPAESEEGKETYVYNERVGGNFAYSTYEGKPYKFVQPFTRDIYRAATLYEPGYAPASFQYPYFYAPAYGSPQAYYYYR